jgi:hypothetical protein
MILEDERGKTRGKTNRALKRGFGHPPGSIAAESEVRPVSRSIE